MKEQKELKPADQAIRDYYRSQYLLPKSPNKKPKKK